MTRAQSFAIVEAHAAERPVSFRLPFRFGASTVTHAPQAFVAVRIAFADGREFAGAGAELMMPRWFDKAPHKPVERNIGDLRESVVAAIDAYTSDRTPAPAFAHSARHYGELREAGARAGHTGLCASFGGALVDRAVTDALCVALDCSFAAALRTNALGIDAALAPDLAGFDMAAFLSRRTLPGAIAVRHTVGLADSISHEVDGTPDTLREIIRRRGHRHFKLKLSGVLEHDIDRLAQIASELEPLPDYVVTLDGNEQFSRVETVEAFAAALREDPRLRRLAASVQYFEQPLPRHDLTAMPRIGYPLLLDEGDDSFDAWPRARRAGYAGVSSKSCKGLYKSIVNAMRCEQWNAEGQQHHFLSGEDLTTPAGLALQQDLALAAVLGVGHVERNGHHYIDGFAGQAAPATERESFAASHADLYDRQGDNAVVAIRDGAVSLRSLECAGYATLVRPDIATMTPLSTGIAA